MNVTITTPYGYTSDSNGHIMQCFGNLVIGSILIIPTGYTFTAVSTLAELNAVQLYPGVQTPAQAFNVSTFVQELMVAFQADANILPYYAVLKDLASYQNFYGMNILINGLVTAGKLTTAEQTTLNTVLANQNIVLSTFTTPP